MKRKVDSAMKRKIGVFALIGGSVTALGVVMTFFLTAASPYVTVDEAKSMTSNNLHLAGVIVPGTITTSVMNGSTTRFILKDDLGKTVPVVYKGPAPANLRTADRAVAIGGMGKTEFEARDLLLKCPSRYEGDGPKVAQK
jgi:cytochrome c-type biogenesis protein CcmE